MTAPAALERDPLAACREHAWRLVQVDHVDGGRVEEYHCHDCGTVTFT